MSASRAFVCSVALVLAACKGQPPAPHARETDVPADLAPLPAPPNVAGAGPGTPLKDRVATLGILNKRNNLTEDVQLKPGESRRWGDVIVRLAACERTAPWERPPETGAFVQVLVARRAHPEDQPSWEQVFSGWLFKNSPSLNVVEHPVYDVWVKDCAMSFPGEESPVAASSSSPAKASGTPTPTPTPSPQASASSST
ncbi:MAG TPA: DUF2155 domain-containing protein [Sphingomonadaceae bacterium]